MRRFTIAAAVLLAATTPLAAQVGYAPEASPYREITAPTSFTATFGRFSKNGGQYGVGANNGFTYGARYAFRANKFIEISLAGTRADLERNVVDPFVPTANRTTGPFRESMIIGEAGLTANLTGGKTWNRLAPFVGIGAGAAFANRLSSAAVDTSGFRAGTRFVFTPHVGTRVFLSQRLHLRLEAKAVFWKLTYPLSFSSVPPSEPFAVPVITNNTFREWTTNAVLQVGIGYALGIL